MVVRGVIASYSPEGNGSVVVNGNPYPFTLERMWQSPVLPVVGMQVDVTFSPEVGIAAMVVVESQPVALPLATKPNALQVDAQSLAAILNRPFDIADVGAVLLLALSWFALPAVTVNMLFLGVLKISFWEILGHYDALRALGDLESESVLGMLLQLLALASLPAALLPLVLRGRAVRLAAIVPLAVMALMGVIVGTEMHRAARLAGGWMGGDVASGLASEAAKMVHVGVGTWIALLAALWLAGNGLHKFAANPK
jgi:hypothetical protein